MKLKCNVSVSHEKMQVLQVKTKTSAQASRKIETPPHLPLCALFVANKTVPALS